MDCTVAKNIVKVSTRGAGDIEIAFPTAASRRDAADLIHMSLCPLDESGLLAWVRWARDIHERAAVVDNAGAKGKKEI